MRILMLSPVFPMPLDLGSKIRIYNLLKGLSRKHEVTLVSLTDRKASREQMRAVRDLCAGLYAVPGFKSRRQAVLRSLFSTQPYRVVKFCNKKFGSKVAQILDSTSFDLIWVNMLNMLDSIAPSKKRTAFLVCDQQNADIRVWRRFSRQGKLPARLFAALNLWKLQRFEKRVLEAVDLVVSVSDEDADFMRSRVPGFCSVITVPNGVDTDFFSPDPRDEKERKNIILFCGSLDITMNIDAARGFANDIFPSVRKKIPDAGFWIVGRKPDARIRALSRREGIEVYADVPDVRHYLRQAKIAVAPFRFGGGTKLKILEAMASGIPLLATRVGAQGVEATDWKDIVIVQDMRRFAERTIHVMQDEKVRRKIAANARKLAVEKYGWQGICSNLERSLSGLIDAQKDTASL